MTHPQGPGQFRAKKAKKWVVAPFWKIPTPPPSWLECSSHLSAQETTQPIKTNHLVFQGPLSSSGFPGGASGKESAFQCRRYRRQFRSLSQEDPLEKEMATHSSLWGHKESDMTKHNRTAAHQALLSMGFPRWKYWSGFPFPPPGDLPDPWMAPKSPESPALAGEFFTTEPPGKQCMRS